VLTNDCQYWLNTNCSIIQKIGQCHTHYSPHYVLYSTVPPSLAVRGAEQAILWLPASGKQASCLSSRLHAT